MTEAEVSLRLALYLVRNHMVLSDVEVAIDGAQVKTGSTVHFPIAEFLRENGLTAGSPDRWQCGYTCPSSDKQLIVHSKPGCGDVIASLTDGRTLRVESKKGPLEPKAGSPEYRLLREAIGQLMTISESAPDDYLAVAVPDAPKFRELAKRWRQAPLIQRIGIDFLLVSPDGAVTGLHGVTAEVSSRRSSTS